MGQKRDSNNRLGTLFNCNNRVTFVKDIIRFMSPFEFVVLFTSQSGYRYAGTVQNIPEKYLEKKVTALQPIAAQRLSNWDPILGIYYKEEY